MFMKNKGGADDVKPLKEPKQWNTWQHTFLSIAHAYNFKDVTNISYASDPFNTNVCTVFELQKKYAFGILVTMIKESSALPVVHKYSDPNATHYGDAQLLYNNLVTHYTKGLTGSQHLEIIERELDELHLDMKWGKTCKSFLNMVDNRLKDHQGIAPDPMQFPDSWYITCLNRTLEPHTTLYQYIVDVMKAVVVFKVAEDEPLDVAALKDATIIGYRAISLKTSVTRNVKDSSVNGLSGRTTSP